MRRITFAALALGSLVLAGCGGTVTYTSKGPAPDSPAPRQAIHGVVFEGMASYYHDRFNGKPTASGERYRNHSYTAAHRSLPFGTVVDVTNLENGRTVRVRINDRGPFVDGRVIDVSKRAAKDLGFFKQGVTRVQVVVVD